MCFAGGDLGSSSGSSGGVGSGSLALQVAGALASADAARARTSADKAALNYQSAVQSNAANFDEWRASDAIRRGQQEAFALRLKQAQVTGTQRASFAARGLSLNEGSPLAILSDTSYMGDVDAATIRDNAEKEAVHCARPRTLRARTPTSWRPAPARSAPAARSSTRFSPARAASRRRGTG
jgi:hypothetical protein